MVSAGGKSSLFAETIKSSADNMLIIADGAAFGSEMDRMMKQIQRKKGMVLYLPESFEWLILQSGIIPDVKLPLAPSPYVKENPAGSGRGC